MLGTPFHLCCWKSPRRKRGDDSREFADFSWLLLNFLPLLDLRAACAKLVTTPDEDAWIRNQGVCSIREKKIKSYCVEKFISWINFSTLWDLVGIWRKIFSVSGKTLNFSALFYRIIGRLRCRCCRDIGR